MTRSLLVMRHGKSDWDAGAGSDAERPLARRGERAARTMGRFVAAAELMPDVVISSPARRARDTARLAVDAGNWACPIEIEARIYGGGPAAVVDVVRSVGPEMGRVLVAGHEPTSSAVVHELTGANVRFPTAAIANIELLVGDWSEVAPGTGELHWFIPPRLVTEA